VLDKFLHFLYNKRVVTKKDRKMQGMISELQGYIAACESNIQTYKEMGDERAVDAAQGMIEKFEIYLQQLESAMEHEDI